jgi:two-component system response regulator AtoC
MRPKVLVVDDELRLAEVLAIALRARGLDAVAEESAAAALKRLQTESFDLLISDLRMPDRDGRQLLHSLRVERPDLPVVIMTAYASLRDAVQLAKEGAFDYIEKPFELDDMVATIHRALRLGDVLSENRRLREQIETDHRFDDLIGQSPAFQKLLHQVAEVCRSKATVLLEGESGTGKEMVARAIHSNSPRRERPFIAVNCAAIPEGLLESELFGHEKGAFTGAVAQREGRFGLADGGTLLLDEIGDMPASIQVKVLRVLQEHSFEAVGSGRTRHVDVRVIAATHRNLSELIAAGQFREDLFYRLNVFPIAVPALRERSADITLLAQHLLGRFAVEMGKRLIGFSPAAEAAMLAYHWPGNVRELQNCVERAVVVSKGALVEIGDLPSYVFASAASGKHAAAFPRDLDASLEEQERAYILQALEASAGVQARAAELLGITQRSLWHRVKKLGIKVGRFVSS